MVSSGIVGFEQLLRFYDTIPRIKLHATDIPLIQILDPLHLCLETQ